MRPRLPLAGLLAAALTTACSDAADTAAPHPPAAPTPAAAPAAHRAAPTSGDALDGALADALARLAPALGPGAEADAVRQALGAVDRARRGDPRDADGGAGGDGAPRALERALDRLVEAHPARRAEADAIRLAAQTR